MEPLRVSAQFAAFVWYLRQKGEKKSRAKARRFAEAHWRVFLPWAHRGLGQLLVKIAEPSTRPARQPATSLPEVADVGLAVPSWN